MKSFFCRIRCRENAGDFSKQAAATAAILVLGIVLGGVFKVFGYHAGKSAAISV